jgi:hypothetical protein
MCQQGILLLIFRWYSTQLMLERAMKLKDSLITENTIVDKIHHACVASYAKMKEYYDLTSDVYTIATVLDPRFKLDYYKTQSGEGEDSATDIKAVVNQVYQQSYYSPPAITNPIITHTPTPLLGIFKKRTVSPHNEFEAYCQDPSQLEGGTMADVLSWWKAHEHTYPNLSRMAKDYLAIPGTSTSSERLFSLCRQLITDNRHRLSPTTIQACECLKSWL